MPLRAAQESASGSITGFVPSRLAEERQLESKLRSIPNASHAESNLKHLTSEPHMAGTEASRRVAEWLRDRYRSFGFDAEIVKYTAWMPLPRELKLDLTKPETKQLASPEQSFDVDRATSDKRAVVGFNAYSPSGEITAPVVYVNYGTEDDYRQLAALGISVEGKIAIVRYGRGYRGIKVKLAEEHKAAAVIIYSDPQDDGVVAGTTFPNGPWRPFSGIQRGSIIYTQIYPGDPLTPVDAAPGSTARLAPADSPSLPHIPAMPISAQDASAILSNLSGPQVPPSWQGGLPFTYHAGPGGAEVHMKISIDYAERPLYDVIAKLHGTDDTQWVILGNHHDAWVYGAADPGSGTASMLEAGRALGELARSGWKPRRTIVICEWDGEEEGILGSTAWVNENLAELQGKAVAYINTDVGVNGSNFAASATPSLKELLRDVTREVADPKSGGSVYDAWRERAEQARSVLAALGRQAPAADISGKAPVGGLGSGSDYTSFFDHVGIPSFDLGFNGPYGVYHSTYDDFYWMKHFGDPDFSHFAELAQILGTLALRLGEADILPYDFPAYALEIEHATTDVYVKANPPDQDALEETLDAVARLSASAHRADVALRAIAESPIDHTKADQINHALAAVEQAFLASEGLPGRPWFKHLIFAPGIRDGYTTQMIPGENDALAQNDSTALRHEGDVLTAAFSRAAARLDDIAQIAQAKP
ncbi:MAG TPA: M28 family metallopeptidase [Candidatus Acidoferrales bacterium]|nr:M28 family metallopeptidase [Candidatus Acidoferrales bacterium]